MCYYFMFTVSRIGEKERKVNAVLRGEIILILNLKFIYGIVIREKRQFHCFAAQHSNCFMFLFSNSENSCQRLKFVPRAENVKRSK